MKEEINNKIEEELKKINPNLKDIYTDNSSKIKQMIQKQNNEVEQEKRKRTILKVLQEAKENGINIEYKEEMTLEELESIAKNIEV